jgi:hypothetical protein
MILLHSVVMVATIKISFTDEKTEFYKRNGAFPKVTAIK